MELNGNTGVLPLFDVVQMLSVNDASGMLRVENADAKGYLYFQEGAVINALDGDHREGEEAAKRVFALAEADFHFSPELPSVAHTIRCSTQTLMMEIARQLDEESLVEGGEASHGERVREAQAASDLLNDIFQKLDEDSRILSLRSHQGVSITSLIEGISTETSVLHVREGAPAEIVDDGRSRPLGDVTLDRRGFEEIRDLLLRSARPLSSVARAAPPVPGPSGSIAGPTPDSESFVLSLGTLGQFQVEQHHWAGVEAVTVHRLSDEARLRDSLPWPGERLDELLRDPGAVLLVTAPSADTLAVAFARVCAHFHSQDVAPFVGFARRWAPLAPRAGRVLVSTLETSAPSPSEMVRRLAPAIVAVEDSACDDARDAALRALRAGSRAVIGVCAPRAAHVASRLLEGLDTDSRNAWLYELGGGLAAVLEADGAVHPVDAGIRAALLVGDVAPLASSLVQTG